MPECDASLLGDFDAASQVEWIETDGVGGVAASTILGMHTRKQHGLLSINDDHAGRMVLLANLQETVTHGSSAYDLSTIAFKGAVDPAGYKYLCGFTDDPWPTWRFAFDGFELEKQFFLVHGEHTAVVVYSLTQGAEPITLVVRPFLAFRDQNAVRRQLLGLPANWHANSEFAECKPFPAGPTVFIAHPYAKPQTVPLWYHDFLYIRDREQGLEALEDLFNPGLLHIQLAPRQMRSLVFSCPSPRSVSLVPRYMEQERERRARGRRGIEVPRDRFFEQLLAAADHYVYMRHDGNVGLYEGLPWSNETMRSALFSLPGLLLVPRRIEEARHYFRDLARQLPGNRILAQRRARSVETLLWVFVASYRCWKATGDTTFLIEFLLPLMCRIGDFYAEQQVDGLLAEEEPASSFSLASNALWYNAQCILSTTLAAAQAPSEAESWNEKSELTKSAINSRFRCAGRPGLAYTIFADGRPADERIAAPLILAAGLPFVVADAPEETVRLVEEHLLTPFGLRSLAPSDSRYCGDGRDVTALPQTWSGSVDPSWIGCYADALRALGEAPKIAELVAPFQNELCRRGKGHISGAYTGDPPFTPLDYVGAACGLAELLRAYARDVLNMPHVF
jgi:glycogen debranching enzyme